ncbi:MAG: transporter substrate-binding domain-containing protein [Saccharospirillaceae bacterium]|nr:transporter substrate-binding domain-containing protein [Pseudomonadales bacterium]NRB80199.1 transporter substrate-binding domain-containing protein [Saccharospirillaceae bacterium]
MNKFLVLILLFFTNIAWAANQVYVAVNREQPPFTTGTDKGLVEDIIKALNSIQNDYEFIVKHVVPDRAKQGLNDGNYDMIAMSNINWGYQSLPTKASIDLLAVQDQFFSLSKNVNSDDYFDGIAKNLTVSVVRGFSYQFLDFEKDTTILKSKFNTSVVLDEPTVIKMVLTGRAMVGVSSSTNLEYFSINNPADHKKLVVYENVDSSYNRHFIISDASSITVDEFNVYIGQLNENGTLQTIFSKYGLKHAL